MSEKKSPKKPSAPVSVGAGPMDVNLLEQIVKLMQTNDLNTVDLRDGERRVILKRGATFVAGPASMQMQAAPAHAPAARSAAAAEAPPAEDANLISIKSPMVGTFYTAASPDAKPFVSVGSSVNEETDVCVIEAMKVFNNVKAECHGTITKILVTNGSPVEFGQVMFLVKP